MKTVLISVPPQPNCGSIRIDEPNWIEQLRQYIADRRVIRFELSALTAILELEEELDSAEYEHQILQSDCHSQFLVPKQR